MIVYILATALACLFAWYGERVERKWPWRVAAAVPLTLVSMCRFDVGTDIYITYLPAYHAMQCMDAGAGPDALEEFIAPLFERLRGGTIDTVPKLYANFLRVFWNQEWGFRQLMRFMAWSGLGFRGLLAVTSALVGGCVFTAIYRQSRSPVLAIYLYVATSNYFLGLNIVRQYVAIGFLLVGVEFVVRRRLLPFLACVAAGMLFHKSVAIALPCYLLGRWAPRPLWCFAAVAVASACSFVAEPVALYAMPKLGLGHYCRYFGPASKWTLRGFEWTFFALNMSFLVFGALYWRKAKEKDPYFAVWYGMTAMGTVALAVSGHVPLMKRVNFYYAAPQFLLLPSILAAEARPVPRRILTAAVVCAFALETYFAVYSYNKNEPLPYRTMPAEGHLGRTLGFERFWWRPGT